MKFVWWMVAALVGFALAASFMDAPARWIAALRATREASGGTAVTAQAQPAQIGRSLAARTRALEEFADRCAAEQWEQAEELRDAAGRAEVQGDRGAAQDFDEQATALYEDARSEAMLRRGEGRCLDQSTYEEMPEPSPRDPPRTDPTAENPDPQDPLPGERPSDDDPGDEPDVRPPPSDVAEEPDDRDDPPDVDPPRPPPSDTRPPPDTRRQDDADEVLLRSRAASLAAQGDPCEGARLLREQGTSQRSLLLARELMDRCRMRRPR
jgi:hypothetical protein